LFLIKTFSKGVTSALLFFLNSVTNLILILLKRPGIGRFHFLYWEVTGARVVHV
jgi:hypothetical protein